MNVRLEDFEEGFFFDLTITESDRIYPLYWELKYIANKDPAKAIAFIIYNTLIIVEKYHRSERKDSFYEFAVKLSTIDKRFQQITIKTPVSRIESNEFSYYYFLVKSKVYRELGITPQMPKWFINVYSGLAKNFKRSMTNMTPDEKELFEREIANAKLQFDKYLVNGIKVPSLIVRR